MPAGDISKTLMSRVRSRVGQRTQQGILDVHLYLFLNRAQQDLMWRLHDAAMPEMTDIAAGTLTNSRVGLPADFMRERLCLVGSGTVQARRIGLTDLDSLTRDTLMAASADNPYYYIWENATDNAKRLHLEIGAPTSTAAYQLYYIKQPTDMDDLTDPILGSDKYNLLVDFAVKRVREMQGEYEEAGGIWKQYVGGIGKINSRYMMQGARQEREPGTRREVS